MNFPVESKKAERYTLQKTNTELLTGTAESIISDTLGDVKNIISVIGEVTFSDKHFSGDHCMVSGKVQAAIIYFPEDGSAVESTEITIPLEYAVTMPGGKMDEKNILITPMLTRLQASAVNPRKIRAGAEVSIRADFYSKEQISITESIECSEGCTLETLKKTITMQNIAAVCTKGFTLNDEVRVENLEGQIGTLLSSNSAPVITDYKMINAKVVVKGQIATQLIYTSVDDALSAKTAEFTVPFSNIIDVDRGGDDCEICVSAYLKNSQVTLLEAGGQSQEDLSVGYTVELQVLVTEPETVSPIVDAYSPDCRISETREEIAYFCTYKEETEKTDFLATLTPEEPAVQIVYATLQPVSLTLQSDGTLLLQGTANVTYLAENNELYEVSGKEEFRIASEPGKTQSPLMAPLVENIVTRILSNGSIELSATVESRFSESASCKVQQLSAVDGDDMTEEKGDRSRIILRYPDSGETLWDIAKKYGTTMDSIRRANGMETDRLEGDTMLLIPKK